MVRQVTCVYGLMLAMVFCNGWGGSVYASVSQQTLKETIIILDRARSNGLNEVHRGVDSGTFSVIEAKEYRQFLNYLSTRIHYYCEELAGMVSSIEMSELPCNYMESADLPGLAGLPPTPGETQTSGEKIDDLDKTLQAALGRFDEMLLSEQEKIDQQSSQSSAKTASGQEGYRGAGPSGASRGESGEEGQDVMGGERSQSGGKSRTSAGGAGSASREADTENRDEERGQLPPEEDDDIVARQLREAAEKETDPEIKEKLWDEYRKYKEGIN